MAGGAEPLGCQRRRWGAMGGPLRKGPPPWRGICGATSRGLVAEPTQGKRSCCPPASSAAETWQRATCPSGRDEQTLGGVSWTGHCSAVCAGSQDVQLGRGTGRVSPAGGDRVRDRAPRRAEPVSGHRRLSSEGWTTGGARRPGGHVAGPWARASRAAGPSVCHARGVGRPPRIVSLGQRAAASDCPRRLQAGRPLQADTWPATGLLGTFPRVGVRSSHGESRPPGGDGRTPMLPPAARDTLGAQLCGLHVPQASRAAVPACGGPAPWAGWGRGARVQAPRPHVLFTGGGKETGQQESKVQLAPPDPCAARAGQRHAGPGTRRAQAKGSASRDTRPRGPSVVTPGSVVSGTRTPGSGWGAEGGRPPAKAMAAGQCPRQLTAGGRGSSRPVRAEEAAWAPARSGQRTAAGARQGRGTRAGQAPGLAASKPSALHPQVAVSSSGLLWPQ